MTLKRKESRRIVVDGRSYRWIVGPNDEGLAIIAEHESGHGQRMVTGWFRHERVISPAVVREAILHALENGWRPDEPGPELVFRVDAERFLWMHVPAAEEARQS
ncbi:MAG TPA: hypothetical protein VFR81_01360 [Longimicrobium sp.]|nr:hypothetical protein [Longimicrobium sp.]